MIKTEVKQKNIHKVQVRLPLHLLNVLERESINNNKTISKVIREFIEEKLS